MPESIAMKKIELQAKGVRVPPELIKEIETKYNFPGISYGWLIFCIKAPNGELLHTFVSGGKFSQKSPYHLVKNDTQFEIWKDDRKYLDLVMTPRPKFYDSFTSDGTPIITVATLGSPTHLNVVRTMRCIWAEQGKACTFCAYRHAWAQEGNKTPLQIAEVVEAAVKEKVVSHVSITTGTLPTKGKGIEELIETTKTIRSRVNIPTKCSFEPQDDLAYIDELKRAGMDVVSINIECFDEHVRQEVMPNAKGRTPLSKYISTWKKCVDLFGKNQVFSVIPAGLGDSDETTLKGVEMIASHDVIPWLEPFHPLPGAVWEDRTPMEPERMAHLYEGVISIIEKHKLDLTVTKAGCVKVGVYGALIEVQKYGL
jgi:radical SAM protein (TIGR04043 family)